MGDDLAVKRVGVRTAFVAMALIGAGCDTGSGKDLDANGRPLSEGGGSGPLTAQFQSIQDNVFSQVCTVCHAGAAAPVGLKLDAANSFAQLVGIPSSQVPALLRVSPGDPDASYVIRKLEGTASVGGQMPLGGPALPQATIDVIRQWIVDGAQASGPAPPPGTPPTVVSVDPQADSVLVALPGSIAVVFSQAMDTSLINEATFVFTRSGGDGTFEDGNEVPVSPASVALSTVNPALAFVDLTGVDSVDDVYRLTLTGTGNAPVMDVDGNVLDGDGDGTAGGDFTTLFTVASVRPTLQSIQDNVFTPGCAISGCHDGPAGPGLPAGQDLSTAERSFASLIDVPSVEVPAILRVAPGNADASYLVRKLEGTATVGERMPQGAGPLPPSTIDAIRQWIDAGAPFDDDGGAPDTLAPVVTLTPLPFPVVGVVVVSAAAVDDTAVAGVRFLVDGVSIGSDDTEPYALAWDTLTMDDGVYQLTAEATDSAGNTGTTAPLAVTVANQGLPDVSPPTVSLAPVSSPVGAMVTLAAVALDDTGVVEVTFLVDGIVIGTSDTVPYTAIWDTSAATLGNHTITAQAEDAAGNIGTSPPLIVTVTDTTAPTVTLTAPVAMVVGGAGVLISAQAQDDHAVSQVQLLVDGVVLDTLTAAPYQTSWDTTTVADGPHVLTARADDAAGNSGTSMPLTVTVNNAPALDVVPPTVELTAPAAGVLTGEITIAADASDDVGVNEVQFFADTNLIGAVAVAPYTLQWDSSGVADGSYALTARAADAAGNATVSADVPVDIDNTGPVVTVADPADGATLDGFPGTLTLDFSEVLDAATLSIASVTLERSGGDGSFGDGNEETVGPLAVQVIGATASLDLSGTAPAEDTYRLTVTGTGAAPVTDVAGVPLDGNGDGAPGDDYVATFVVDGLVASLQSIQDRIFTPVCAGCHGGFGPTLPGVQDLSDTAASFASLVNVVSILEPPLLRVLPGNPDASYLIDKLEGTQIVGFQMPQFGTPLPQADIDVVRAWILSGADP